MKHKKYRSDNRKFWKKPLIEVEYTVHDCPVVQELLLIWVNWRCDHCDHLCLNTEDTNTEHATVRELPE